MNSLATIHQDKYLLISAKPAPNGPLHIGHLGGPYLRQDMLHRHYRLRGADVVVLGGTDPVDSFIALRARQDGVDPTEVAHRYHERIAADFADYNIHFDDFIEPLSPRWRSRYVGGFDEIIAHASDHDRLVLRTEPFPFAPDDPQPVAGAWVCGGCPDCDRPVSGYFCEHCGAHFEPHEIRDPRLRSSPAIAPEFVPSTDLFFDIRRPDDRLASLEGIGVPEEIRSIVERQFRAGRTRVRLTEPAIWGIRRGNGTDSYFGHGLLYGYCRMLGRRYQELTGATVNPFDEGSKVTTVNLFGVDNTVSHMVNIQAIGAELPGWRGFDAFVVNRFLMLENRKISTSARHSISLRALLCEGGMTSDGARFVLASAGNSTHEENVNIDDLVRTYNDVFIGRVIAPIRRALADFPWALSLPHQVPQQLQAAFEPVFDQTCDDYLIPTFDPAQAVRTVQRWVDHPAARADNATVRYGWLKTVALLLEPLTPILAQQIWRALGERGRPALVRLQSPSTPTRQPDAAVPEVAPITAADLADAVSASASERAWAPAAHAMST